MKNRKNKEKINKDGLFELKFKSTVFSLDEIKEFLEEQAAKGYMLVKTVGNTYYFRKTDPCNAKFSLEIFNKRTRYENIEAENKEEFIERCKELGWNYVCSDRNIHCFYTEDNNIEAINITSREKISGILKCYLGLISIVSLVYIMLIILPMLLYACIFDSEEIYAIDIFLDVWDSYDLMIYMFLAYLVISIFKIIMFISPNIRRIKEGKNIRYLPYKIEKWANRIFYLIAVIIMVDDMFKVVNNIFISLVVVVAIIACILLSICLGYLIIRRFGNNKKTKIVSGIVAGSIMFAFIMAFIFGTITCVVRYDLPLSKNEKKYTYTTSNNKKRIRILRQDNIPFTFKDLGVNNSKGKYYDRRCDERETIFGKISECYESIFDEKLNQLDYGTYYEVLDTDFEFIKKSYINKMIDSEDYYGYKKDKNEAKRWHANEVYKLITFSDSSDEELYDIIVVYKDKVFFYKYYCDDYFKNNTDIVHKKILKW